MDTIIEKLLQSDVPSVRYKVLVNVLGKNKDSEEVKALQENIKSSQRVKEFLSERNETSKVTAERATDIFLKRRLYIRQRDGEIIDKDFVTLHYPCYWHYDILFGLKVMAEAGFINDERCNDALDLLESKRLSDGGFPAEKKYYQHIEKSKPGRRKTGSSLIGWGVTGKTKSNEFVTADALYVLKASGRL
jgi:hypothetical protein